LKFAFIGNYQRVNHTEGYRFWLVSNNQGTFIQNFNLAETALEMAWNIREKVMQLGNQRISKGTKWPRMVIKVTKISFV
jgi:hypothetical protein